MGPTYDSNGNLTNDGAGNTYTWDSHGKMATANGYAVTYDAFGRPVAGPSGEILYTPLGKAGVLENSALFNNAYVPLPGGGALSLGCCVGGEQSQFYLHRDWIGSSRVASNVPASGSGSVDYSRSFSPYGDVYPEQWVSIALCWHEFGLVRDFGHELSLVRHAEPRTGSQCFSLALARFSWRKLECVLLSDWSKYTD